MKFPEEVHPPQHGFGDEGRTREAADNATTTAHDELRRAMMAKDTVEVSQANLEQIWGALAARQYRVADAYFSSERCYLALARQRADILAPIEGRRLEILEAVLSSLPQKNVASELSLAPSTIALNSRLALETMGVYCKPSRAHPLLMLAAWASSQREPVLVTAAHQETPDAERLLVLSTPRPDARLAQVLPAAELSVIRRLVEGNSYATIAAERGTSMRTVANQITAVFRRLRVSGRNELVHRLFCDESLIKPLRHESCEIAITRPSMAVPKRMSGAQPVWSSLARRSA